MNEINDMLTLSELVRNGETNWSQYGYVRAVYHNGLVLFDYSIHAQIEGRWNWFERASRGLILNAESGEVVALPFEKFFNWGEGGRKSAGHLVEVTEKMDGSLGILYRHKGQHHISTRGSFTSDQAIWATEFLHEHYDMDELPDELTLLFEIIYPENRIVVNYGQRQDLVLIGARNRFTGEDFRYFPDLLELSERFQFSQPSTFSFNSVTDIIAAAGALDANNEGWVMRFSDGSRFKMKGDRYIEIHRIVTQTTFRRVLESVANGSFDAWIATTPDELLTQIRQWRTEIDERVRAVTDRVKELFMQAPRDSRKDFALWVQGEHRGDASYLFAMLDGHDILPIIYRREFDNE